MKNLNENPMMQEVGTNEMKDINGGFGITPIPVIVLELLQKAYGAIMNE